MSNRFLRLKDVCDIKGGYAFKSTQFTESGVPLIRIGDISDNRINITSNSVYISVEEINKYEKFTVNKGDILVALSGATTGKFGIYNNDNIALLNQRVAKITPKLNLNNRYLYHYMNKLQDVIYDNALGAAQPNISTSDIEQFEIFVPEIKVQGQIANTLDIAQELIDKRKAQIEALDQLVKSRFIEMFGNPKVNPRNWNVCQLSELVEVPPQNGLYKPASEYVNDNSGVPILRIDAFYDGKVTNFSQLKRLKCTDSEIEKYSLKEQDIVINRVNSIEYLGKCALIEGMQEYTVFESNMMRFHLKENLMDACFATRLLCSKYMYEQIVSCAKKAVNQASINQKDVLSFKLYVPPIDLQKEFAEFIKQVDKLKFEMEKSLKELENNFNSLMQRAFKGELFN